MGQIVVLRGVLRGKQHQSTCEVVARKHSANLKSNYSDCFVLTAPEDLPNGSYVVEFDGHKLHAAKENDIWLTKANRACSRALVPDPARLWPPSEADRALIPLRLRPPRRTKANERNELTLSSRSLGPNLWHCQLHRLRTYDHHLIQLVSKQAWPKMPR